MCENAHAKHRKPQSIQGSCNYCEGAAIKDKYHLTAVWIALNQITFQLTLWKVAGATVTSEDYRQAESTDVPVRDWQQAAARREREKAVFAGGAIKQHKWVKAANCQNHGNSICQVKKKRHCNQNLFDLGHVSWGYCTCMRRSFHVYC